MLNSVFGLGSWRFLLAFFVVISHLWADMFGGPAAYAVWGFFVLSGFLMTEILRHKYGFSLQGLQKYAFNRFLRIFPLYYLSFILGLMTILIFQKYQIDLKLLNPQFYIPESLYSWISNLTLFPLANTGGRPVPVSGALAVEVGVYLLIPFMAYSKNAAWLGTVLSLVLSLKLGITVENFPARYSDFLTGYFAFAIGSLINHYKDELHSIAMPKMSLLIWGLHCLVIGIINTWPWTYGLYVSVLLSAWVVISLYQVKSTKIDTLLGDLSYPVYLLHTIVGGWLLYSFGYGRSFTFFIIAFAVTVVLSWILLIVFDHPIQRLKKKAKVEKNSEVTADELLLHVLRKTKKIVVHKLAIVTYGLVAAFIVLYALFVAYKIMTNDKLEIYSWGPNSTVAKSIPNLQPDGNAGLWIETSMTKGLGTLTVYINENPVHTEVATTLITATIPKEFFDHPNVLKITIKNNQNTLIKNVGSLQVLPKGDQR